MTWSWSWSWLWRWPCNFLLVNLAIADVALIPLARRPFPACKYLAHRTVLLFIICILYFLISFHFNKNKPSTINQKKSRDRNYRTLSYVLWTAARRISLRGVPLTVGTWCSANPIICNLGSDKFHRCFSEICFFKQTWTMLSRKQKTERGTQATPGYKSCRQKSCHGF